MIEKAESEYAELSRKKEVRRRVQQTNAFLFLG